MRAAEQERFRQLAAASLPWMTRTATALTGDRHRGDDLVQEALVKAYVHWRRVRGADDPRAYLRRILVRCHLDAVRSGRSRETPSGATTGDTGAGRRPAPVQRDHADGTHDRLLLLDALAALTVRQRSVLVLRFLEDVDVAGTAEALGISPGTVKSTTHDALRLLRARLGAPDAEAPGPQDVRDETPRGLR